MAKRPGGLGKDIFKGMEIGGGGLSTLIPGANEQTSVMEVSIDLIEANPWQPRTDFDEEKLQELADSIKQLGIVQPLTLRKNGGKYQIIAGERRFRASKLAGKTTVPAYIREAGDEDMLQMALVENIQRDDLNPIEEALSYQRLMDECRLTQELASERVGKKRATVANALRLLKLPDIVQDALRRKVLSAGHARALLSIENNETQIEIFNRVINEDLSVRKVEEIAKLIKDGKYESETSTPSSLGETLKKATDKSANSNGDDVYADLCTKLRQHFGGLKVKFARTEKGNGKITIPFKNDDELERIMALLDDNNNANNQGL